MSTGWKPPAVVSSEMPTLYSATRPQKRVLRKSIIRPGTVPESNAGDPHGVCTKASKPAAGMNHSRFSSQRWVFVSKTSGEKPVVWPMPSPAACQVKPLKKTRNSKRSVSPMRRRNSALYVRGWTPDSALEKNTGESSR
jgi:hypothetical protein